jgi:putative oxidoreductase
VGGYFIAHGTQKLFGWFGGDGLEGSGRFFESLELRPGRRNALAAGATESLGGLSVMVGFLTPLAAAALIATMITAIRTVHFEKGPLLANGGYEYNLVLIGALAALVDGGPGALSLDRKLGLHETGAAWAIAALLGGAAASTVVIELARSAERSVPMPRPEPIPRRRPVTPPVAA